MLLLRRVQVPGTYFDALNPNTKLGKAVRAACDELSHLSALVRNGAAHCPHTHARTAACAPAALIQAVGVGFPLPR